MTTTEQFIERLRQRLEAEIEVANEGCECGKCSYQRGRLSAFRDVIDTLSGPPAPSCCDGLLFSQRNLLAKAAEQWCHDRSIPPVPLNVVAALDALARD